MMPAPEPVMIRGVVYPSGRAAAKALGVSQGVVQAALERGTHNNVGLGRANVGRSVTIRGVTYPTMTAAASELGVTVKTVKEAMMRGTEDNIGMVKKC